MPSPGEAGGCTLPPNTPVLVVKHDAQGIVPHEGKISGRPTGPDLARAMAPSSPPRKHPRDRQVERTRRTERRKSVWFAARVSSNSNISELSMESVLAHPHSLKKDRRCQNMTMTRRPVLLGLPNACCAAAADGRQFPPRASHRIGHWRAWAARSQSVHWLATNYELGRSSDAYLDNWDVLIPEVARWAFLKELGRSVQLWQEVCKGNPDS